MRGSVTHRFGRRLANSRQDPTFRALRARSAGQPPNRCTDHACDD